ncbi:hypothetical protein CWO90_42530 [Bradyrhizobium sp. Leo121]|nr:hypothetical protein CWO90_42530 [Bradyrhizobium sp. Leo121]
MSKRPKQDRARVAGGQRYEIDYEPKKTGRSAPAVKKAVKKVGNSGSKSGSREGDLTERTISLRHVCSSHDLGLRGSVS